MYSYGTGIPKGMPVPFALYAVQSQSCPVENGIHGQSATFAVPL